MTRSRQPIPKPASTRAPRTVEAQLIHHDDDLVDITARTADGREAVLHATSDHPFWNATDHTWTPAGDLRPGTRLTTPSGTPAQVTAVTDRPGDAWMYNLTVADLHTYYVLAGATPVLVHNSGGVDGRHVKRPLVMSLRNTPRASQRGILHRSGITRN
ncbi:hypothetical protein GCM10020256_01700 [Streptomyces thermocoprophilus]